MVNGPDRRPHFLLEQHGIAERFTSPKSGRSAAEVPARNRAEHAAKLRGQLQAIEQLAEATETTEPGIGLQIEFRGFAGIELTTESLARDTQGIELQNVREEGTTLYATVYVPHGKLAHFERLLTAYVERRKDKRDRPLDHQKLIDAIRDVRVATVRALWTDDPQLLPEDRDQIITWEVWLPVRGDRQGVLGEFRQHAAAVGWQASTRVMEFPERTVLACTGSTAQLEHSVRLLSLIAELRRAKESADFFDALPPTEQLAWAEDLSARTQAAPENAPYVCVLDTGINRGHVLLAQSLAEGDLHTVEPAWTSADADGHGTGLAGVALYGDLTHALQTVGPVALPARLESVKLLREGGDNEGRIYGALTQEGIARAEVTAANRRRIFNLAITATDSRDRGRPSSWSAALDALAADWEGEAARPRLILVSAGNTMESTSWIHHPTHLGTELIHDPGQSWNALTIGAYTEKINITEPDAIAYQPIARHGSLSPFTTTSTTWERKNPPWKPDVVFEGGNAGRDGAFASTFASLSLLTTHHLPQERLFTTTNATSAATALGANMAAHIARQYPQFWPETIRALIVHSARWTQRMEVEFAAVGSRTARTMSLLRHCGYGVPDLDRAMWSAADSLTLIVQDTLQPFEKTERGIKTRDMHLHDLPWPRDALEQYGELEVKLRVTLSYFIEPNPGDRGSGDKYVYQSHALRFEVRRPQESAKHFRARINRLAQDEEEGTHRAAPDPDWRIGDQLRRRGSIHSDVWSGTAAELANRGLLAVYPAVGWWRRRLKLGRYDRTARYALIVSIEAPDIPTDLYNIIATQIAAEIQI
ncbi:MAG TPA: S8 family peptidase [Steroidobacteraceae bacterium]|nr:S8 family peptidase [Steroidobacteraceae bacterium]